MITPSGIELVFMAQLNAARANPRGYGATLNLDLAAVPPTPPLVPDLRLWAAARDHSWDMAARRYFSHWTPEGIGPDRQLTSAGYDWQDYGQSIAAGTRYADPAQALAALIVDDGHPDLGHRLHLLAMTAIFRRCDAVGVGTYTLPGSPYGNYWTVNTGRSLAPQPWDPGAATRAKVRGWYQRYLGREPDPAGGEAMAAFLLGSGADVAALEGILASDEYYARAQTRAEVGVVTPEVRFLDRLYIDLLGRFCDPAGLAAWGPQVARGVRWGVVRAILGSSEYQART